MRVPSASLRQRERRPHALGVGLHACFELQLDGAAAHYVERVLVKERRGNEKQRIRVASRLDVEMGQKIVKVLIANQRCLHPKIDLEHSRSTVEAQLFCGLYLHREALSEVPPNMDFEVAAIIVGKHSSWDEAPVRGENGDLGELGLGDDTL